MMWCLVHRPIEGGGLMSDSWICLKCGLERYPESFPMNTLSAVTEHHPDHASLLKQAMAKRDGLEGGTSQGSQDLVAELRDLPYHHREACIDHELAYRGWPSNPRNAARAGWFAAARYFEDRLKYANETLESRRDRTHVPSGHKDNGKEQS